MSFRKEFKVPMSPKELVIVKADLIKLGLKMLFPSRLIKSIYFDDSSHSMFHASEDGVLFRKKIRLRTYDNNRTTTQNPSNITLEKKISSIEGRFKVVDPIDNLNVKKLLNNGYWDENLGLCRPVTQVEFERSYLSLNGIRFTFDKNIRYRRYESSVYYQEPLCVLELKVPFEFPESSILKTYGWRFRRFSKYCRSLNFIEN